MAITRLQELSLKSIINHAMITLGVVLLDNEHKVLCLITSLVNKYWSKQVLLDFGVQPLMLGQIAIIGLVSHK
jgi:hypothetical protein